jgi:malate dehydrogenase (oxaloacetate-decarboxylating)(NADP+)
MIDRNYFGCMMVETGDADAMISGLTKNYADTIRPALQIIGTEEGVKKIAGMYLLLTKSGPLFLADTTVNFNPTAEELADITILVAKEVKNFNITPRIAMLSYSNFGSSDSPEAKLVAEATKIVKRRNPSLIVDGEIQAWVPFNKEILKDNYPFCALVDQDVAPQQILGEDHRRGVAAQCGLGDRRRHLPACVPDRAVIHRPPGRSSNPDSGPKQWSRHVIG